MINAYLVPVCSDQLSGGCDGKMPALSIGRVYNPEMGKSLQNIPPGRELFTVADDWHYPIYRASKQHFSKE